MNERIRSLRKALGLTMEKFGDRLGVKKNSVSQWESGTNNVTEQMFKSICREFSVKVKSGSVMELVICSCYRMMRLLLLYPICSKKQTMNSTEWCLM